MLFKWNYKPPTKEEKQAADELGAKLNISPILAQLLMQRGITTESAAKRFFHPQLADLINPFLMKDMDLAAGEDAPQLILGIEKQGLLKTLSPKVHILLDVPAHHIHAELTGTVTAAQTVVTAPTARMQDSDVESLVQLRKTIESIVQFVQTAAQSDDAAASPAA